MPLRGGRFQDRENLARSEKATHSTPKGSLMCKAASGFQIRSGTCVSHVITRDTVNHHHGRGRPCHALSQEARDQFRAAFHTKLYEDVAQMELDRLHTNRQPVSNLSVG